MRRSLIVFCALALAGCLDTTDVTPSAAEGPPIDPTAWEAWNRPVVVCGDAIEPSGDTVWMLARRPYIQSVSSARAVIVWGVAATAPSLGTLEFGQNGAFDKTASGKLEVTIPLGRDETAREIKLVTAMVEGVEPGSEPCWRIRLGDEVALSGRSVRLAPPTVDAPVDFLVIGDYGGGSTWQTAVRDRMAAYAATAPVDLFITTGDNAYPEGTHDQFEENAFQIYTDLWGGPFAVWPSAGNHDYGTDMAQPYLDNFVLPRQALTPADQERYYSYDWGPLHVVVLDSEFSLWQISRSRTDDMADWLAADLAATDKPWKIAVFHQPAYTGNPKREPNYQVRQQLLPILEEYGVQVIFNGHEHFYERFAALREGEPTPVAEGGIAQITTGAGGRSLYNFGEAAHQEAAYRTYHYVRGGIRGCRLWIEAVDYAGTVIDRASYSICD